MGPQIDDKVVWTVIAGGQTTGKSITGSVVKGKQRRVKMAQKFKSRPLFWSVAARRLVSIKIYLYSQCGL